LHVASLRRARQEADSVQQRQKHVRVRARLPDPRGPRMSHSRIMAGGGDTSVLPANGTPFSLEPLFDAVDSVMTYDSASRRPASCRRAARRAATSGVPHLF